MKKKNKIIILITTILVILSLFFLFYALSNRKDTLTIAEKQWIDNNKTNVIDISVLNDVPAFTYNGNGVIFDFLNYISKDTNLSFNPSAFRIEDTNLNSYSFTIKDKKEGNDILIFQDNYVLVFNSSKVIKDTQMVSNTNIGILESDINRFSDYFNDTNTFTTFKSANEMIAASNNIDALILLKSDITKYISSKGLSISYEFLSETKDFVITLKGDNNLNSILTKYYNKWSRNNFDDSYYTHLLADYYDFKNVPTLKQTDVKSKTYVYGFVEDGIYDKLHKNKLVGLDNLVLKSFSNFSNVEIKYKKYANISSLVTDYENGKVDIMLDNNNYTIKKDSFITKSAINSKILILSAYNNPVIVNSIRDLKNYNVATVKNSKISKILKDNNVKFTTYPTTKSLIKNKSINKVIVMDAYDFEYYKTRNLKNYKIDSVISDIDYNFVINNSNINQTFASLFNFYTNYININTIVENGYDDISYKTVDYFYLMLLIIIIIFILLIIAIINKVRLIIKKVKDSRKNSLTKEEKLKFIDQLTSLKNRAYLNSKVEQWDESEVYPQCIIVIDLNNIAYINDNYGREEGDKIILQAANILITSQLPNTEIIRTDGNEFLIYLVGYQEKTVITYLRKLSRLFKNLDHGFGAASGYSMITDAIKTFDDAVNEATIDMRNNKDSN